jgi:SAM-dependent methyltransferase
MTRLMTRLEIGPGYAPQNLNCSSCYRFNPHYLPALDTIYLDINPPEVYYYDASWVVADAQHLPFRPNSIDEIYAAHVIEHLEDPLRFLSECHRVLKRGGTVTVVTPNFLSMNAYLDPDHKHVFNFLKLWRLVRMAGLVPHFGSQNIGSLLPHLVRRFFKLVLLVLSDNLVVLGEKP